MRSKKPVIIFLHGWGESQKMWNSILPYISNDCTVYALDLPGFGDNQNRYTVFSLDDHVEYIDKFFRTNNIEHAIFVGHSFGGRVATLFTLTYPKKVDKLVLYSSSIPLHDQSVDLFSVVRNFINSKLIILFSVLTRGWKNRQLSLRDYTQLRNMYTSARSRAYCYQLDRVKQPVLLMAGRFDVVALLSHQRNLLKHFAHAQLVIFNRSTHVAHVEEKKKFISVLKTFIQS